ncbi:MAG: DUF1700 domain-containing protein [Lactobacillales bacterium]|nr:DUF1700 domain-containing protein [Lactobacillales bacterium]
MTYFKELASYLTLLNSDERNDVVNYYQEYALDAGLSEAQIKEKFGTAKKLARQILAEYSMREDDNYQDNKETYGKEKAKKKLSMIWLIILGLLASPVLLPLAFCLVLLLLSLLILVAAAFAAVLILLGAMTFASVFVVVTGFGIISQSLGVAFLFIGCGIGGVGISLVIWPLLFYFIRFLLASVAKLAKYIGRKFIRKPSAADWGDIR